MKDFIEEAYGIKVVGISPYGNGQTSNVYKVIGDSNSYIFKSHFHEQIASNEFHCLEILSKISLSPSPIRSKDNKIYTEHSRKFYILMHFINIKGCDKSEINYVHLGKTIKSMHSVLSNLKLNNISERFFD